MPGKIKKEDKIKKNGGVMSRVGEKFYKEVERIKDARLKNGKSKDRVATEKVTNLMIRHEDWKNIATRIIEASEEEVERYGKE
ncbi:MAG: hypothetical protein E3J83_05075 [Candidatus Atribacteria bacterium]|nr:MAG: hypothetical protein E3J83_05075 [Candidatus Atribacteria bacterium]